MARLIPFLGRARWVQPAKPPHFTVRELYEYVRTNAPEGSIELVDGFRYGNVFMLISGADEVYNLPVNESASVLARKTIRGNAILVSAREWNDLPLLRAASDSRS